MFVNAGDRNWFTFIVAQPLELGLSGGIGPVLVNTAIVVGIALAISVMTAVASITLILSMERSASRIAHHIAALTRGLLSIGASTPRLLVGIGAATVFGNWFGLGITALCGILSLACILGPIMANGLIHALDQQKDRLMPTCIALGLSMSQTWLRYIAPAALPGLLATSIQCVGRGLGDAAALYLTSGTALAILGSIDQPAATLAVYAYSLVLDVAGGIKNAYAAGFVLLILTATLQTPLIYLNKDTST